MKSQEYLLFNSIPYKVQLSWNLVQAALQSISKTGKKDLFSGIKFYFLQEHEIYSLVKKAFKKSLFLKFVSIGDTGTWGRPVSGDKKANWRSYYSDIWKEIILKEKRLNIIFIDGRFRVSCCLYAVQQVLELNWKQPLL